MITPINTKIGPNVSPKKPKPKGSLSSVITKKPMNIIMIPISKVLIRLLFNGKEDLSNDLLMANTNLMLKVLNTCLTLIMYLPD